MSRETCRSRIIHITKEYNNIVYNYFVPAKCKSWECPLCRRKKAKLVRDYINKKFAGRELWMLTFTDLHRGTAEAAWETLGKRWNRVRTWCTKNYGKFNYVRIIEPHKKGGWPHMHVLVDVNIARKEMVKLITQWGWGWQFHSKRMSVQGASRYVSKYLTKEWPDETVHELRKSSGARIVQANRGLGPIFFTTSDWRCVDYNVDKQKISGIVFDLFYAALASGEAPVWLECSGGSIMMRARSVPSASPPVDRPQANSGLWDCALIPYEGCAIDAVQVELPF